jgi:transaldolase
MSHLDDLHVRLFADGANLQRIRELAALPWIRGFTTNPTLMRQAGVADYEGFAHDVLRIVTDRPVCFEVFADDFDEMAVQAEQIASWGPNVYVKVPVTNTRGDSASALIEHLSATGVKLNVTAVLTLRQVREIVRVLSAGVPAFVSIFAGRIADTGRDPVPIMSAAVDLLRPTPHVELIWASPRELLNIFHAESAGCQVITLSPDILNKLALVGKDLAQYSLDTVQMFYDDAARSGYVLAPVARVQPRCA